MGTPPTLHRRYLTFSLRTLFILFTASAVWLGVVVNRAHTQREAVKAIEALGGFVYYDWQLVEMPQGQIAQPPGPAWLLRVVGNDFFQEVNVVLLATKGAQSDDDILKSMPYLRRLPKIYSIGIHKTAHPSMIYKLVAEFPKCTVGRFRTPRDLRAATASPGAPQTVK